MPASSPEFTTNGIVLDQLNGTWGKPDTVAPSRSGSAAQVMALSCAAARNCAAVGFLPDRWGGGPSAAAATEVAS